MGYGMSLTYNLLPMTYYLCRRIALQCLVIMLPAVRCQLFFPMPYAPCSMPLIRNIRQCGYLTFVIPQGVLFLVFIH